MKKKYLTILSFLTYLGVSAQVLNPSFETWTTKQNQISVNGSTTYSGFPVNYSINDPQFTYNELQNWSSLNQLTPTASVEDVLTASTSYEQIKDTSDFVAGTKAVFIESREMEITVQTDFGPIGFTNVGPGIMISGDFVLNIEDFAEEIIQGTGLNSLNPFTVTGTGQAIDFRPETLSGSYKYIGVNSDSALVFSGVIKNREMVAYTIKRLPNTSVWTDFELDYEYLNCEMPDTIVTFFCSSNLSASFDALGNFTVEDDYTGEAGSALFVDDLSLDTFDVNNFPPIAFDDSVVVLVNETATSSVLLNDEFCGGGAADSLYILTSATNGTDTVLNNDSISYTPANNFSGTVEIEYVVCNVMNICDTASLYVTVTELVACVANDDYRSLNQDEAIAFDATFNDDDCGTTPDIIVLPVNGTADVESNGNISYAPVSGYSGADSLTYVICSPLNASQCDTAVVYFDILAATTGIEEIPASIISIAPNPAMNYTNVSLNGENLSTTINVFNLLGNKIYTANFENSIQIDTKNFARGVYLIQLENELGRAVKKLVIAK